MQKFVRRGVRLIGVALVAWVGALGPNSANAATVPALTLTGGTVDSSTVVGPNQFGWSFTVSQTIEIVGLGLYDHNQDGLSFSHRVRVWDNFGSPVFSVIVPSGSGDALVDQFRYLLFFPGVTLQLNPGTYFVMGTYDSNETENFLSSATGLATDPRISYVGAAFGIGLIGAPSLIGINNSFFGPNFLLSSGLPEVPLPAALPLFATGLGALGLLGWRRKKTAAAQDDPATCDAD